MNAEMYEIYTYIMKFYSVEMFHFCDTNDWCKLKNNFEIIVNDHLH